MDQFFSVKFQISGNPGIGNNSNISCFFFLLASPASVVSNATDTMYFDNYAYLEPFPSHQPPQGRRKNGKKLGEKRENKKYSEFFLTC